MTEVLTKSFWKNVKKTFQGALDGEPAKENAAQISVEVDRSASHQFEPDSDTPEGAD
jgi:hypothetical protein